MRLKDKVAIVTGGAHGMGEAEARLFAAEGAKVVVADILEHEAEIVAADIRAGGEEAMAAKINVTSESEWVGLIAKTVATYGKLDILVNNAGISGSSVSDPDGLEGWDRIIAVNQTSVFLGTKLAAEQMAKTGGGSIINMGSSYGIRCEPGFLAYAASKESIRTLTKTGAREWGKHKIRVNTILPSAMSPKAKSYLKESNSYDFELSKVALGYFGTPDDIAPLAIFLASDASIYVTGQTIGADGGSTMM